MAFRRPTGSQADVKELEYISALHQTCLPNVRDNGTVSSIDIMRFMKSRIGIETDHSDCLRIVRGLGGGVLSEQVVDEILRSRETVDAKSPDEAIEKKHLGLFKKLRRKKREEDVEEKYAKEKDEKEEDLEEYLDLVQLLAALLIPTLARAGKEWKAEHGEVDDRDDWQDEHGESKDCEKKSLFARIEEWDQSRRAEKDRQIYESLRPKPENLVRDGLVVLLQAVPREIADDDETISQYPVLTSELVQALLEAHEEYERAADEKLVQQMVEAASSSSGLLDEEAFVNALTSDVNEYPVASEDRLTTSFYDVFGFESLPERDEQEDEAAQHKQTEKESLEIDDVVSMPNDENGDTTYKLSLVRILAPIDFSIDAHSSVVLMVGTWVFFVLTVALYASLFQTMGALQIKCDTKTFGCQVKKTVITWVLFAVVFVVVGYVIVIPLGFGNNPRRRSPRRTMLSLLLSGVYTWIPYAAIRHYRNQSEKPYNATEDAVNSVYFHNWMNFLLAIGCLLSFLFLHQFVLSLLGNRRIRNSKLLNRLFATSIVRGSARTKKAATRKINTMLQNAHSLHSSVSRVRSAMSHTGSSLHMKTAAEETMVNYVVHGEKSEDCGGLLWTWKGIVNGSLFDAEGIWFCSRLLVFQFCQLVLAVLLAYVFYTLVEIVAVEADKATKQLEEDFPNAPDWVKDIVPTGAQARGALYPAATVAICVVIVILLIYLPSYTGTVLMYRSGVLPSLKSHYFTKYRTNVDLVYGNIGNAIYALLGTAVLFWALIALLLFLYIWNFSRNFMILVTAWGIGLTITIVAKMLLTKTCRKKFFAGLYRTRPGAANLSTLALECWFIGLGGGVLIGRFIQFILAACFWVGRTDRPFLSEDVSLMGYGFDYVPTNFVKDLLVHEAHHHPYLERLLTIYLLKLKNQSFCSDAGACWRQLLVVSFMPWMMKDRVSDEKRLADATKSHTERLLELEEENRTKGFTEEIMTGMKDMADQVVDRRPKEEHDA